MLNSYYEITDPTFTGFVGLTIKSEHLTTNLKYKDEILFFEKRDIQPVTLVSIEEVILEYGKILLKGLFYFKGQLSREIEITYTDTRSQLLDVLKHKIVEESAAKLIVVGKSNKLELDVKVKKTENVILLYDASTNQKLTEYKKNKDMLLLSKNVLLNIIDINSNLHYLIFNEGNIPIDITNFQVDAELYYHLNFELFGSIGNRSFNGKKISLLSGTDSLLIFSEYSMDKLVVNRKDLTIMSIENNGSIVFKYTSKRNELSYFIFSKVIEDKNETSITGGQSRDYLLSLPIFKNIEIETNGKNNIIIDEKGNPYKFEYNKDKLSFYQSNKNQMVVYTKDYEIELEEYRNSGEMLIRIKLNNSVLYNEQIEKKIIVDRDTYTELLYLQYKARKRSLMEKATLAEIYSSWGRQVNDYLLYNFFGQLVILNNGIKEIENNNSDSTIIKNRKMLNFMYYSIREQKKLLDRVSIGFPSILYDEEKNFLDNHKSVYYERMQKQLIVYSNQVQRYLSEIESSLNALNFAIIPRRKMEEIYENRPKRGYLAAGILGGLGVLTGGIGLIAAGGLFGLNTYLSNSDTVKVNQYNAENDNNKIDFYINKALDSYEHLMLNILPYYISQVSNAYYSTHQFYGEFLLKQTFTEEKITYKKEEIFNRLGKLYVEKRIPLDSESILTIDDIVKELVLMNNPQNLKITGSINK